MITYELAKKLYNSGFSNGIYLHEFREEPNDNPLKCGWNIKATCKHCGETREYSSACFKSLDYNMGCSVVSSYRIPTLSELIEAMQSRYKYIPGLINDAHFLLLKTFGNGGEKGYIAYLDGQWESIEIENRYRFYSSTPEEAVANLWLELNNNK